MPHLDMSQWALTKITSETTRWGYVRCFGVRVTHLQAAEVAQPGHTATALTFADDMFVCCCCSVFAIRYRTVDCHASIQDEAPQPPDADIMPVRVSKPVVRYAAHLQRVQQCTGVGTRGPCIGPAFHI